MLILDHAQQTHVFFEGVVESQEVETFASPLLQAENLVETFEE